jgi:uncharacterized protein YdaU (DUF1376 family)
VNYFPFHIGDYLSATRHLSWEEDMAYRRLLDVYYTTEKPIPADHKQACRLVLATTETQREAVQTVLAEFFELTESGWINTRADAEIVAMREKQQKQRDKANAMWEKRKAASGISTTPEHGNASSMPRHQEKDATASKNDANAMPPTPTPTPTPTPEKNTVVSPSAPPADRGIRLAKDWELPADWRAWCEEHRPDLEPDSVAAQFRDFWVSKPGKDGRKTDWLATWRNWCRSQKPGIRQPTQQERVFV